MKSIYPQLNLQAAVRLLEKRKEIVLKSGLYNKNNLLIALGFSENSGPGQSAVVSLTHYGFLKRTSDGRYCFTNSAKSVIKNDNSEQKVLMLKSALLSPELFNELANAAEYSNVLKRHGLSSEKSKQVLDIYKSSDKFANAPSLDDRKTLPEDKTFGLEYSGKEKSISIDFGNGTLTSVPLRIILEAYINELQRLKDREY